MVITGSRKMNRSSEKWASQVVLGVKNPPANAGDVRDVGSIPGLGRSPGGGHGNSIQYPCMENSKDRGGWQATIPGVAESRKPLGDLTMTDYSHHAVYNIPRASLFCK